MKRESHRTTIFVNAEVIRVEIWDFRCSVRTRIAYFEKKIKGRLSLEGSLAPQQVRE